MWMADGNWELGTGNWRAQGLQGLPIGREEGGGVWEERVGGTSGNRRMDRKVTRREC